MYKIYIKPLNFNENRYIFMGNFGAIDDHLIDIVKYKLFHSDINDPYNRSFYQLHPDDFFCIKILDFYTEKEIISKIYDVENDTFFEEV